MALEDDIQQTFTAVEIELPETIKLLLELKDKFNIKEFNADTILKSVRDEDVQKRIFFVQQDTRTTKYLPELSPLPVGLAYSKGAR